MKKQAGFTLIEVMITLAILSILIGYFMLYFSKEINSYYTNDYDIEFKQDARIAIDRIVTKIRSNNGLTFVPGPESTGVIYKGTDILINTTKNDSNGEINYYFDTAKGVGEIRNASGNVIANNIKDFKLEKEDITGTDGLVRIFITTGNNSSDITKQYSTAVRIYELEGL